MILYLTEQQFHYYAFKMSVSISIFYILLSNADEYFKSILKGIFQNIYILKVYTFFYDIQRFVKVKTWGVI